MVKTGENVAVAGLLSLTGNNVDVEETATAPTTKAQTDHVEAVAEAPTAETATEAPTAEAAAEAPTAETATEAPTAEAAEPLTIEEGLLQILKRAPPGGKVRVEVLDELEKKVFGKKEARIFVDVGLNEKIAPGGNGKFRKQSKSKKAYRIRLETDEAVESHIPPAMEDNIPPANPLQGDIWARDQLKELREELKSDMTEIKQTLGEITESLRISPNLFVKSRSTLEIKHHRDRKISEFSPSSVLLLPQ